MKRLAAAIGNVLRTAAAVARRRRVDGATDEAHISPTRCALPARPDRAAGQPAVVAAGVLKGVADEQEFGKDHASRPRGSPCASSAPATRARQEFQIAARHHVVVPAMHSDRFTLDASFAHTLSQLEVVHYREGNHTWIAEFRRVLSEPRPARAAAAGRWPIGCATSCSVRSRRDGTPPEQLRLVGVQAHVPLLARGHARHLRRRRRGAGPHRAPRARRRRRAKPPPRHRRRGRQRAGRAQLHGGARGAGHRRARRACFHIRPRTDPDLAKWKGKARSSTTATYLPAAHAAPPLASLGDHGVWSEVGFGRWEFGETLTLQQCSVKSATRSTRA